MTWGETIAEFIRHNLLRATVVLILALIGFQFETGPWVDFGLSVAIFVVAAWWGSKRATRKFRGH